MPDDLDSVPRPVPSPCVRNCCLDHDNVCLGCFRTMKEICAWHDAPDDEKLAILIRCRMRHIERHGASNT
jgi:predicted Fe-S protein YdhL (DUF1289 family)